MKILFQILILINLIAIQVIHAKEARLIRKFQSDMCTSSPNGTWGHCCYEHDFLYWIGGSFEQRLTADDQLMKCMILSGGPGHLYRDVVRITGTQFWSSAWENSNTNQNISLEELEIIKNEYDLWASLGQPRDFDFVMQESIVFEPLSTNQKNIIFNEVKKIKNTKDYKDFLSTYEHVTGTRPITESNFL